MADEKCKHCNDADGLLHQDEHAGLCCDCFDLSCGMPLRQVNDERAAKGKAKILRPWPRKPGSFRVPTIDETLDRHAEVMAKLAEDD